MAKGGYLSTDRIETLVDGVFAIAMTLLAFDLRVPDIAASLVHAELPGKIFDLGPRILLYVASFAILGFYWIGHHIEYNYIKYTNRPFLWINIFFLTAVGLIPFTTGIIGRYAFERISVVVYGLNIIILGMLMYLHWSYATTNQRLTHHQVDHTLIELTKKRVIIGPIGALFAIAASFISIWISLFIFIAVPMYYVFPSKIDTYWKKPSNEYSIRKK